MIDSKAIANLQMQMNTGDGRQAVLAELLDAEKWSAWTGRKHKPRVEGLSGDLNLQIRSAQGQRLRLLPHRKKPATIRALLPEDIIVLLDRMPVDEKIPLMTFAEGLAYHYNNLFMGLIGHISIVMHHIQPSHQAYEGLRQCEELILNTASLIRLLVDVFHRSDCRQATLYPIDLSDHEISRLIFADHSVTVPVEKISQTEPCVQQILKTIAGRIATRLTETLHDLEMQIRQVFVGNRLNAPYRHHIRQAMRYLKKGKRIAHNLLDFSGTVKFNAGRHDLLPIIKEAAEIYQTCFSHIGLELDLAPNPIIVTCDRHLLRKAILDLIGICGDIDRTCNDLRISLNCVRSAAHDRRSRMRAPFVKLEFRHSSTQADVEYLQQAFDPFLSKSNKYISNLGPAAAMGIIRRHGGKIEYQPDGSMRTYNIYLPLTTVRRLSVI